MMLLGFVSDTAIFVLKRDVKLQLTVARLNNCYKRSFIIVYADDILLIALTVSSLEFLLRACERELQFLDMSINVKKSSCIRIGNRCNVTCASIMTCHGQPLQ